MKDEIKYPDYMPPDHEGLKICFAIAIVVAIALTLFSCNTPAHAVKKFDKLYHKQPIAIRAEIANLFPPDTIVKIKTGKPIITTRIIHDSANAKKLIKRIDSLTDSNQAYQDLLKQVPDLKKWKDSITDAVLQDCPTWNEIDTVYRVDTTNIIDSKTKVQLALIPDLQKQITQQTQQIKDITATKNTYQWAFWILLFLVGLVSGYSIFKYFSKLKVSL